MSKTKIALLYERLSRDDELQGESFSIQNQKNPHLHSVHNNGTIRHLHERGDANGTAQEKRIKAQDSVGQPGG